MEDNLIENIGLDKDPFTSCISGDSDPYGLEELDQELEAAITSITIDEDETGKVFQDRNIVRKILSANDFGYLDLLKLRGVCKVWNDVICHCESGSGRELLWTNACLCIGTKNKLFSKRSWEVFVKLDLNTRFHCPNFIIVKQDLRNGYNREFFLVHGLFIKNLKLDRCKMSLVTFQEIISLCPNLECLEIIKVPEAVIYTETLACPSFPNPLVPRLCTELTKLRSLNLHSNSNGNISNNRKLENDSTIYFPAPVPDLHPAVLAELLEFARPLERIKLVGWGGQTANNILSILVNNPLQNPSVKHLEFRQIKESIDAAEFYSFIQHTRHLSLQTFALTFETQDSCDGGQRRNIHRLLRKLIRIHGNSLLELDLKNCPVSEDIFHQYDLNLPKLKRMILTGTEVKEVFSVSGLMPKLEILELGLPGVTKLSEKGFPEFPRGEVHGWYTVGSVLADDNKNTPDIFRYFETLTPLDNLCLRGLGPFGIFVAWRLLDHFDCNGPPWNSGLFFCLALVSFLPHLVVKKHVDKLKEAKQMEKFLDCVQKIIAD